MEAWTINSDWRLAPHPPATIGILIVYLMRPAIGDQRLMGGKEVVVLNYPMKKQLNPVRFSLFYNSFQMEGLHMSLVVTCHPAAAFPLNHCSNPFQSGGWGTIRYPRRNYLARGWCLANEVR